jgi:hypothetical protein
MHALPRPLSRSPKKKKKESMMGAGRFVFSSSSVALRSSKENKTTVEMKQKDKKNTKAILQLFLYNLTFNKG